MSSGESLNDGVWFQAKSSGLWYRNPNSAGQVFVVKVHGLDFLPMPYRLTAENGAKAALVGEFSEFVHVDNPDHCGCGECDCCLDDLDEPETLKQEVPVSWSVTKQIYNHGS